MDLLGRVQISPVALNKIWRRRKWKKTISWRIKCKALVLFIEKEILLDKVTKAFEEYKSGNIDLKTYDRIREDYFLYIKCSNSNGGG